MGPDDTPFCRPPRHLFWSGCLCALLASCAHTTAPLEEDSIGNEIFVMGIPKSLMMPPSPLYSLSVQGEGHDAKVSLACHEATIRSVLLDLLYQSAVPYRLGALRLHGLASLRLQDRPLLEACNALLRPCEASARWDQTTTPWTLCVDNRPLVEPPASEPSGATPQLATQRVRLHHRDVASMAKNLLGSSSTQTGISKGSTGVSVAVHPESNYLYLRGAPKEVERLVQLVHLADKEAPVVKVELFLLARRPQSSSVNQSPSWTLNINNNSFLRWIPGATTDKGVGFTAGVNQFPADLSSQKTSLKWKSSHQIIQGRFIGHTELMVQTGQPMSMSVGKTGYALRTTLDSGVPSGEQAQINATTQFTITPNALPSGQIALDISQTTARFTPSTLSANTSQRSITGSIVIPNGGFVMLGGTTFHLSQIGLDCPLWLRKVPGLSAVVSQFDNTVLDEYVITLVRASLVEQNSLQDPLLSLPAIPVCDLAEGLSNVAPYQ
jgi:hypothetical protein